MTLFWILAAGLCLLATSFILLPLYFGKDKTTDNDREGLNIAIYSERLAEYKHSLEGGEIDAEAFGILEIELKKNLLSETEEVKQTSVIRSHGAKALPLVVAIMIPLFAVFSYSDVGLSWGAIEDVALAAEMKATAPHDKQGMTNSVEKLAKKLKSQPDNHDGWFLLAQSYLNMAEFEKSSLAFKFLVDKFPQDHAMASYYAETIYLADNRQMTPRVVAAIDRTLSLNPEDVTMLELKAMEAFHDGKLLVSLEFFNRALTSNPDPERAELIKRAISRLEEDLALANIPVPKSIPAIQNQQANSSQISSKTASKTASQTASRSAAATSKTKSKVSSQKREIQVLVEVADSVDVGASMSVFVFARAVNGPPMPLAVERLARGSLPKLVTLNESMAMMEGMGLANFDKVQVVARISSTGIANVSPDDYQALSETIDLTNDSGVIKLRIEKQVKDFQ